MTTSAVITDFGILNTVAIEAQGPNGDHPDVVADVAKYVSVFGAGSNIVGTPYPGTFMLDGEGRVTARFFEEFYRERNTTANVMLRLGEGLSPIEAIEGSTAHLKFTAYASDPAITVGTRFSVAVEIEPNPGMHLYAPGADQLGYRVLGLSLSSLPPHPVRAGGVPGVRDLPLRAARRAGAGVPGPVHPAAGGGGVRRAGR